MKEYIERNALIAELEDDLENDVNMYSSRIDKAIRDDKYAFACDVLASAPVADVREIVHAKWINAYPDIEPNPMFMYGICSNCGFEQSVSDSLKYCPDCGAKMDAE